MERLDIMVMELLGVEGTGFLLDQRLRKVEQLGVGLGIADIAEIGLRLVHLIGVAQRLQDQPAPARSERDDIFAAPKRQLPQPDLARPLQRLAQHDEGFLGQIVGGHDEIGALIIKDVDFARIDEAGQLERLFRLQLHRVDLVLVEQDVIALGDLIALHDLVGVDRADIVHDLLVMDRLATGFVDLLELDGRAAFGGRVDFDRDRHEREAYLALPVSACGHGEISVA